MGQGPGGSARAAKRRGHGPTHAARRIRQGVDVLCHVALLPELKIVRQVQLHHYCPLNLSGTPTLGLLPI
eukprot:scaffold117601_cov57-Phaeocystis_antarctica.AAC.2